MKSPSAQQRHRQKERGSILVICMVLASLGTIGVAAWISLLDARGNQVEANISATERRVMYRNSRALAYRALYANHLHSSEGVATDTTYTLPDGLGACTIKSYTGSALKNATALRTSRNGASPLHSYTTDVSVSIADGTGTHEWEYQLRSYNPILGGELLALHPAVDYDSATPLLSGNLNVEGRAVLWDVMQSDLGGGFRADEYLLPNDILGTTTFTTTSSAATLPLNYPLPVQTTGLTPSGPAYLGELDLTASTINSHNAYATRIAATGNFAQVAGSSATSLGPGVASTPDGGSDDAIELEIQTQSPTTLMATLPGYYPLSSRILRAVATKNNPAFTEDQIFNIFDAHIPIADDALTYLMGPQSDLMPTRTDELHRKNGTWVASDGKGTVRVYLESPNLPHLILSETSDLRLIGQVSDADAAIAETYEARMITLANEGGFGLNEVLFEGQNRRRLVLALSTGTLPGGSPYTYTPRFLFTSILPFPRWHTVIDLQNTGALVDTSAVSGATIVGGIRANRGINVSAGTLTLEQQFEPLGLETMLSRNAWIEAYKK